MKVLKRTPGKQEDAVHVVPGEVRVMGDAHGPRALVRQLRAARREGTGRRDGACKPPSLARQSPRLRCCGGKVPAARSHQVCTLVRANVCSLSENTYFLEGNTKPVSCK